MLELPGPSPLEPWEFNGSLFFNYANKPSTEFENASHTVKTRVLDSISSLHFGMAMGMPYGLTAEITAPYHVSAKGKDLSGAPQSGGTLGDTRLAVSWAAQPPGEYEWPVTLRVVTGLPTGDDKRLLGEKLFYVEPQVIFGQKMQSVWWTGQAGLRFRKANDIGSYKNSQQLTWGVGAFTPIYKIPVDIGAEWTGAANLSGTTGATGITSVFHGELIFWPRLSTSVIAYAGGDPGLKGFGAPLVEFGLGVRWTSATRWRDSDEDGADDYRDQCPTAAEDRDGFQDEDGCPEPDNDNDGVLDVKDKCSTDMEDKDGFQDDDGCPDPDNDSDGLLDKDDQCPMDAEDFDGFQDQDGCPDPDNDKDALLDEDDRCPNEAEDRDGFEDQDGCPDPDNDKDGVLDTDDLCPSQPEDFNGYEDKDGCPEGGRHYVPPPPPPPPKPLNLFDTGEEPAKGPSGPKAEFGTKLIESPYQFAQGSAELNTGLKQLLEDVVYTLKASPELVLIVEVYADPQTPVKDRETLVKKRRDIVKDQIIVERGVDPARVNVVEVPQPQLKGDSKSGAVRNIQVYLSLTKPK